MKPSFFVVACLETALQTATAAQKSGHAACWGTRMQKHLAVVHYQAGSGTVRMLTGGTECSVCAREALCMGIYIPAVYNTLTRIRIKKKRSVVAKEPLVWHKIMTRN